MEAKETLNFHPELKSSLNYLKWPHSHWLIWPFQVYGGGLCPCCLACSGSHHQKIKGRICQVGLNSSWDTRLPRLGHILCICELRHKGPVHIVQWASKRGSWQLEKGKMLPARWALCGTNPWKIILVYRSSSRTFKHWIESHLYTLVL